MGTNSEYDAQVIAEINQQLLHHLVLLQRFSGLLTKILTNLTQCFPLWCEDLHTSCSNIKQLILPKYGSISNKYSWNLSPAKRQCVTVLFTQFICCYTRWTPSFDNPLVYLGNVVKVEYLIDCLIVPITSVSRSYSNVPKTRLNDDMTWTWIKMLDMTSWEWMFCLLDVSRLQCILMENTFIDQKCELKPQSCC